MIEQDSTTRRRILAAHIPPRLRGLSLLEGEERRLEGAQQMPDDLATQWYDETLSGLVVAAVGHYETCGRGLWATRPLATAYLTALMRDLMVQRPFSGLYVSVDNYLDSIRPDGDRRYSLRLEEDDLVVLANVGSEPMTDWTRAAVRSLLIKRFDAGLPTLVSATVEPSEYLSDSLAKEMFLRVAIMKVAE